MADGLVDTNVFIHAQTHDAHSEECLRFLESVRDGRTTARLDPIVLHELSYAIPHYRKGMSRSEIADYLLIVLGWKGIAGNVALLVNTVLRWRDTAGLAFVDAYLAAVALEDQCPVYTKNVAELLGQGAMVPDPLPRG